MAKAKSQLQGGKKVLKPQGMNAKKKSKLRKKIFVKGGLRDGHGQSEISAIKSGPKEQDVNKTPTTLKSTSAIEVSKDTQSKKLPEVTAKKKKIKKNKKLLAKGDDKDDKKGFVNGKQQTGQPSGKALKMNKKLLAKEDNKDDKKGFVNGKQQTGQPSGKALKMNKKNSSVTLKKEKKSKKKANGSEKQNGNSTTLPVQVKRAITNIKSSKEKISSNWEAFKEIGLHKNKENLKDNSKFDGIFRNKRKAMPGQTKWVPTKVQNDDVTQTNNLNSLDLEDSYIKDLVPPEGDTLKAMTKCVAIDCEMVGVGDGKESALARVSLVNQHGACIYDKFVKPKEDVVDYRTKISGVRAADVALGEELEVVQKEVAEIVSGRILVGHALRHDLKVLFLTHPYSMTRDTSKFKPFKVMFNGQTPSLKNLALKVLGVSIQGGEHSSVEDAKATMQLYNLYSKDWEEQRRIWALRKHEKMLKLKQEKNAETSENGQTNKEIKKTTPSKRDFPRKSPAGLIGGINVLDEYVEC